MDINRLTPGNIQVTLNGATITGQAVYLFGGFADEVGPDVALLHLSAPFNIGGSTTSFRNQLWNGSPHGLFGKTIAFYGQGRTECTGAPTGGGIYLAADFVVDSGDYVAATTWPRQGQTIPPRRHQLRIFHEEMEVRSSRSHERPTARFQDLVTAAAQASYLKTERQCLLAYILARAVTTLRRE